jgi:hypothetical protein
VGTRHGFGTQTCFVTGVKLYSDQHLVMQPLYILESAAWARMFGVNCIVSQIPALAHVLLYCAGMFFVLRESDWPDWQKAIVLGSSFVIAVAGHNYRLDDYHVTSEILILYSMALLLMLARTEDSQRQSVVAAGLGVFAGLTITSRVTDGVALLAASCICLLFLARRRRLFLVAIVVCVTALTVTAIVRLTGDTFSAYISSTVFKAAASKGGTGSIFAGPFLILRNASRLLLTGKKWLVVFLAMLVAVGAITVRRRKLRSGQVVLAQLGVAAVAFVLSSYVVRMQLLQGMLLEEAILCAIVVTYLLAPLVAVRFLGSKATGDRREWDVREVLVLFPLSLWVSNAAGAAGEPLTQYYAPVSMLLLLIVVVLPLRKQASWANASFVSLVALVGLSAVTSKVLNPYSWNDVKTYPMFVNRAWFEHPIYGLMYIDRDDLQFSQVICSAVQHGDTNRELLSLPWPGANYSCGVPPWHGYVQTYFDTSKRETVEQLMDELKTDPPQWIVYQRELHIMAGAERLYNHGQPLAQRDLDGMIMQNVLTGKWRVAGKENYPPILDRSEYLPGDGWYLIRTR